MAGLFTACLDSRRHRQHHAELGAPRLRVDRDAAVVVPQQPLDDVEAEPGALADRLGGEEGIEDAVADRRRDAGAVVDDPHHDALPLAGRRDVDAARLGTASNALSMRFAQIWFSSPAKPLRAQIRVTSTVTAADLARALACNTATVLASRARRPPARRRSPGPCA